MVLAARGLFLKRRVESPFQNAQNHGRRQMEHLAAGGHLALVAVVGNLAVYQRFTVVDTAGTRHIRIRHVLCEQGIVPEFAGPVGQVSPEGRGLVTGKKHRKALGAHAQVQMTNFHLGDFGFAKRTSTHVAEYNKIYI